MSPCPCVPALSHCSVALLANVVCGGLRVEALHTHRRGSAPILTLGPIDSASCPTIIPQPGGAGASCCRWLQSNGPVWLPSSPITYTTNSPQ